MEADDRPVANQPHVLSVTALNQRARQLLETHYDRVWVEGEISNFARPSSGHWYFTLKDGGAQIRCAMFRSRNQLLKFRPENGMQVTLRGRLSIYEARGDYQLIGEHLEESGIGALQRAFEQLKQQLDARGWFDPAHKRALPAVPGHIGVVTSPSGAALHDILTVLKRRFPSTAVTLFPTTVQGEGAARQVSAAIRRANDNAGRLTPPLEALIVARGGGSLEDLWAFNEEIVAGAIFRSHLPVVSAVGHETDFSIADFVADYRAPTPSAAAEMLSPDQRQWLAALGDYQAQLIRRLAKAIGERDQQLNRLRKRLKHPRARLQEYNQRLDEAELHLLRAHSRLQRQRQERLLHARERLQLLSPQKRLSILKDTLARLEGALLRQLRERLVGKLALLELQAQLLDSVSPLNTLQRGYAIVEDKGGRIVRSSKQLAPDDTVHIRLSDGGRDAKII